MTVDTMTTQRRTIHASRLIAGAALSVGAAVGVFGSTHATTTPAASSGRLTYAKWIGDNPEIFVANADGADEVQLTADPNRDLCPAFTPDGTAIVFCSDRSGSFEIWMMNIDGTDQRQVTRTGGRMLFPKVSPDGTMIAFSGATTADAPDEETDVIEDLVGTRADVMKVQDLMVDQALDGVEETPADEHAADERRGPALLVPRPVRRHQDEHAGDRDDPRRRVEDAVAQCVQLQVLQRVRWRRSADHVVPLEDLMEDDAVEESTQSDSEEDGGDDEPRPAWLAVDVHRRSSPRRWVGWVRRDR
jgi:dipeptidyl aminopeptidase/acylaminoacyl peptidase